MKSFETYSSYYSPNDNYCIGGKTGFLSSHFLLVISSSYQFLSPSYISKRTDLLKVLRCLIPQCPGGQILGVPVLRIIFCPTSELIIGSYYLHFYESCRTSSYYFISSLSPELDCELEPGFLSCIASLSPHPSHCLLLKHNVPYGIHNSD